ncbi:MAG: glycosyltransferase [Planctomycetota bacterium]
MSAILSSHLPKVTPVSSLPQPRGSLVMVITELDEGGAEKAFVRIACGLKTLGWAVQVISLRDAGRLAEPLQNCGIPVTALNAHGPAAMLTLPRLTSILRRIRPDVVFSFLHEANLMTRVAGWLAGICCRVCSVRVVDRRPLVTVPERLTQRLVTHFIACSESVASEHAYLCGIPPSKISVIRNGVDVDTLQRIPPLPRSDLGLAADDFVVLMAGRLTRQKSPHLLLQAFEQLQRQSHPRRIRLLIAGEGPERDRLSGLAATLPDPAAVCFLGWRSDLANLMKTADLFVLPSAWEGLPNVLLEAQASGLPVAATAVDGCMDVIRPGVTGQLFPPNNPGEIARLIADQLHDPGPAATMAAAALQGLRTTGRWEACIDECDRVLMELCRGSKAG